jgi:hypothetical protein
MKNKNTKNIQNIQNIQKTTKTTKTTKTNPLINFLIDLLKSFAKLFNKITPIIWILEILRNIKGIINSFFTSFRIIRESFDYLNKLPVFQLFRKSIRFLSLISLIFNLVTLSIFSQFSPLSWIYSIPALSQIGAFVYDSSPEKAQGFILWISLKIKTLLLWIWHIIIDNLKLIIKTVLGEIENYPQDPLNSVPIDVDKDKYGDINNKEYLKWFISKLDEYKYYIIITSIVTIGGIVIYLYWDSISCSWRRDGDDGEPFVPLPTESDIHGPDSGQLPSPDSSSSGSSFNKYFRSSLVDRLSQFKNKVSKFIEGKSISAKAGKTIEVIPRGIYEVNGLDYYNGLPLPRVETLGNGTEFYFSKDRDGFINVLNNTFNSTSLDVIRPVSGKAINRVPVYVSERIAIINKARSNAIFTAPENSYARNPLFDGVEFSTIGQPSLGSTSTSNLPKFDNVQADAVVLDDINITPRAKPTPLPFNLDNPFDS